MASTATASGGYEKQGTGENNNAWGIRLNTSLDLLDERLDGVASSVVAGDYSISITNYASSAGRHNVQVMTGTPPAAFTVTLPGRELNRWFHNLTGKAATISLGSGTTATVKDGALVFVYTDGSTGVFAADPTLLTLDKFAAPVAAVAMNSQKITGLANGTNAADAVNLAQLQAAPWEIAETIAPGSATGQTIIWNGTAYVPGALDLADSDARTGLLPLANGGTGAGTAAGARAAILGATAGNVGKAIVSDGSDWVPTALGSTVSAKSGAYTVIATDARALFNCTSTFTLALTAAATLGAGFAFSIRNSGTGVITIDPNSAELIDGRSTIAVYPGEAFDVFCTGTEWITKGRQKGLIFINRTVVGSSVASVDFELGFSDPEITAMRFLVRAYSNTASDIPGLRLKKTGTYRTTSYLSSSTKQGTGLLTNTSSSTTYIYLHQDEGVADTSFSVDVDGIQSATAIGQMVTARSFRNTGPQLILSGGRETSDAVIQGVRFYDNSGNVDGGTFEQFGVRI